jgi:hypothetical protein
MPARTVAYAISTSQATTLYKAIGLRSRGDALKDDYRLLLDLQAALRAGRHEINNHQADAVIRCLEYAAKASDDLPFIQRCDQLADFVRVNFH